MLGQKSRALSATFLSSTHLYLQKDSGQTLDPVILLSYFCRGPIKQVVHGFEYTINSPFCLLHTTSECTMHNMKTTRSNINQSWLVIILISFFHYAVIQFPINTGSIHGNLNHFLHVSFLDAFFKFLL